MVATIENVSPSVEHPVALILGTGLGHLADLKTQFVVMIIVTFQVSLLTLLLWQVTRFEATIGTIDGVPVVVYPGRAPLSGYSQLVTLLFVLCSSPTRYYLQVPCRCCLNDQPLRMLLLIRLTSRVQSICRVGGPSRC